MSYTHTLESLAYRHRKVLLSQLCTRQKLGGEEFYLLYAILLSRRCNGICATLAYVCEWRREARKSEWTRTIAENPGSPCTYWCMSETVWPNAVDKWNRKKRKIHFIYFCCVLFVSIPCTEKKNQNYYTFRKENSIRTERKRSEKVRCGKANSI